MFSGIVQEKGVIQKIEQIQGIKTFEISFENCVKCSVGDSVAVNGTCLTVTKINLEYTIASFDAVPETLEKTNLNNLSEQDNVNIEIAIRYGDLIGGHMVQGHVDEIGIIKNIDDVGGAWVIEISASTNFLKYLVDKGFVVIDGMSITVIKVLEQSFTITLTPHTIDSTIAKNYQIGSILNLEADATGKYVYKYVQGFNKNV